MKRTFLVVGLFTALLLAGVGIILAPSSPPATPGAPDPPSPPPPPLATAPARPPVAAPFKGGKLHASATRPDLRRDGVRRGETSTPTADRVTQKAVRRALHAGSVQSRLAHCMKVEGFGGTSASGPVRAAPASLLLELEASGGELRVVDARVREWGGASEAMVSCARAVLRSLVVRAPKTSRSAGERMQMHFLLNPRGDAVASR